MSAICYTVPKSAMGSSLYALESGSDFKSRGRSAESRVLLGPGVTTSTCDVMVIDDSEYEEEEEFEIVLADASNNARIGRLAVAKVLISGPNDASTVSLGNTAFTISEDAGNGEEPLGVSMNHLLILHPRFLSCLTMSLRHGECHFLVAILSVLSGIYCRASRSTMRGSENGESCLLCLLQLLMAEERLTWSQLQGLTS